MPKGLNVTSLVVETLLYPGIRSAALTLMLLHWVTIDNMTVEVVCISIVDCYRYNGS